MSDIPAFILMRPIPSFTSTFPVLEVTTGFLSESYAAIVTNNSTSSPAVATPGPLTSCWILLKENSPVVTLDFNRFTAFARAAKISFCIELNEANAPTSGAWSKVLPSQWMFLAS